MRLRSICCLLFWLCCLVAQAEPPALIPLRVGQRFGYCDAALRLVIPANFQDATPFMDGRAVVQQNDRYGLIDESGKWLLQPEHDEITAGKLLRLRKGKLLALADTDGCLLTEFCFNAIYELKNGFLLLERQGYKGMADPEGQIIVPCKFENVSQLRDDQGNFADLFLAREDGLMGIYNTCGEAVHTPRFSRIDVFQEGFAVVQEGSKFGLIDLEGALRVACAYDQLQGMSEGLVAAKLKNRWGFIDATGAQRLPFVFEAVQDGGFFQGRAPVSKAGSWVFVQRDGEVEFPLDDGYQSLGSLSEGLIPICKLVDAGGVRFGYVDPEGRLRIPLRFERAEPFHRGFAIVAGRMASRASVIKETRFGIIDRNGRTIVPMALPTQTEARLKRDSLGHLGYTTFNHNGRQCKVDARGKRFDCDSDVLGNIQKAWLTTRCEQGKLVAVAREGKWGFCDLRGKVVIPCQFAAVHCFAGGLARVWSAANPDTHYYIDESGRPYFLPAS